MQQRGPGWLHSRPGGLMSLTSATAALHLRAALWDTGVSLSNMPYQNILNRENTKPYHGKPS